MARDPVNGVLYGYDSKQQSLVSISGGAVSNYLFPSIPQQFTSIFFDKMGQLYGLGEEGSATSRKFFEVNHIRGTAEFLQEGPVGNDTDACSCPYTFKFFRKVTPQQVVQCGEVVIEYSFLNTSGSARTNLRILDELPEGLIITEIVENTNAFNTRIQSGVGTNKLDLTRMEALLGTKSRVVIKAKVGNEMLPGMYSTQATLENLPLALDPALISDNIATSRPADPNFLEVLDTDDIEFEDLITYDCDNNSALLTAPLGNADGYVWSDESTESTLMVDIPGTYWVEMQTECGFFTDYIQVDFDQELPTVDLGPDQVRGLGEQFSLKTITNIRNVVKYRWSATDSTVLSCTDCANPTVSLLNPETFEVTLTDTRGCQAQDQLFVDVNATKRVLAPTAFTPNDDGVNDLFFLQGTNAIIDVFGVFDRWGNLVFEHRGGSVNDTGHAWDGQGLVSGVYIWYGSITYPDGTSEKLSGTISLIR